MTDSTPELRGCKGSIVDAAVKPFFSADPLKFVKMGPLGSHAVIFEFTHQPVRITEESKNVLVDVSQIDTSAKQIDRFAIRRLRVLVFKPQMVRRRMAVFIVNSADERRIRFVNDGPVRRNTINHSVLIDATKLGDARPHNRPHVVFFRFW